jgi:hypothetical protein
MIPKDLPPNLIISAGEAVNEEAYLSSKQPLREPTRERTTSSVASTQNNNNVPPAHRIPSEPLIQQDIPDTKPTEFDPEAISPSRANERLKKAEVYNHSVDDEDFVMAASFMKKAYGELETGCFQDAVESTKKAQGILSKENLNFNS